MNAYETAAKYMTIVQKAGARHSAKDMSMVQEMHDRARELGAKCNCEEMAVHPTLRAAVEALILRHPGHPNQKVHGNRFGGFSVTKESLRRLKGDKEARTKYKESAKKRAGGGVKTLNDVLKGLDLQHDTIKVFQRIYSAPKAQQPKLMSEFLAHKKAKGQEAGRRAYERAHGRI